MLTSGPLNEGSELGVSDKDEEALPQLGFAARFAGDSGHSFWSVLQVVCCHCKALLDRKFAQQFSSPDSVPLTRAIRIM